MGSIPGSDSCGGLGTRLPLSAPVVSCGFYGIIMRVMHVDFRRRVLVNE